jgi:uncharacterized protein YacL
VKIINNNHNYLTLKNNPYPMRILGGFFFIISSMFVYGSLGGYTNYDKAPDYVIKLHFIAGSIGVLIGSWLILTKSSFIEISAATQTISVIKSNLLSKTEVSVPFNKIKEFFVSEKIDDGSPIWKIDVELKLNESFQLTDVWHSDREQCDEAVNAANNLLHFSNLN